MKTPLFAVGVVLLLGGCHASYVKLNSVAQPESEKAIAYRIKPANAGLDPTSLGYKEVERFVKTALSGKGLYEALKPEAADMVVSLDYGISAPIPIVETRNETVSVQLGDGKSHIEDKMIPVTVITYVKYLRLTVETNNPPTGGQPPAEIWRVDVTSEGENHDLRKALPALAAATIEFVGRDSHGQKTIELKDNEKDGPVAFVKKGM